MTAESVRLELPRERTLGLGSWELWVAAIGVVAAVAAVAVTLDAGYFVYPGWLALQKADFILGPIGVGLYWHHRRPASRFGLLLIAIGLLQIPNAIFEGTRSPALFTIGYYWETAVYLSALALILSFPTGRPHLFPEGLIFAVAVVVPQGVVTLTSALSSESSPGGTISACRDACPRNVLVISEDPTLALRLLDWARWGTIAVASATALLLVWRVVRGTRLAVVRSRSARRSRSSSSSPRCSTSSRGYTDRRTGRSSTTCGGCSSWRGRCSGTASSSP